MTKLSSILGKLITFKCLTSILGDNNFQGHAFICYNDLGLRTKLASILWKLMSFKCLALFLWKLITFKDLPSFAAMTKD